MDDDEDIRNIDDPSGQNRQPNDPNRSRQQR
jgi:hypothetical protein